MNNENVNEYEEDFDDYVCRKLKEAEEEDRRGVPHLTHEQVFNAVRERLYAKQSIWDRI